MIARLTTFDYFNPLPRKEGDDVCKTGCKKAHDFNPLPRKEGDGQRNRSVLCQIWHFNPLPRKEGDWKSLV